MVTTFSLLFPSHDLFFPDPGASRLQRTRLSSSCVSVGPGVRCLVLCPVDGSESQKLSADLMGPFLKVVLQKSQSQIDEGS